MCHASFTFDWWNVGQEFTTVKYLVESFSHTQGGLHFFACTFVKSIQVSYNWWHLPFPFYIYVDTVSIGLKRTSGAHLSDGRWNNIDEIRSADNRYNINNINSSITRKIMCKHQTDLKTHTYIHTSYDTYRKYDTTTDPYKIEITYYTYLYSSARYILAVRTRNNYSTRTYIRVRTYIYVYVHHTSTRLYVWKRYDRTITRYEVRTYVKDLRAYK